MGKEALALTYRPKTWSDVTEQGSVVAILQHQIDTKSHKNCYLFTGPAGCGKTTSARIFANDLNGGKGTPIEIDGASNNGIEQVRNIIEQAKMKPLDGEYKVFIIDEVHAVSSAGFQAMLKLFEEPPKHAIFLLCTTNPEKLPATILSRVQRFDFKKISQEGVIKRLTYILAQEMIKNDKMSYEAEAVEYLARISDGGMRDAITLMDKCLSFSEDLTVQNVLQALGIANYDVMVDLLNTICQKHLAKSVEIIENVYNSGVDLTQFMKQFWLFVLDVSKYELFGNFKYLQLPNTLEKQLQTLLGKVPDDLLQNLLELNGNLRREQNVKQFIEATLFHWLRG